MAEIAVINPSAAALGLHDKDASYRVASGLGGVLLVDPDMTSASVLDALDVEVVESPAKPTNGTAPSITGTAKVGQTLTCSEGKWTSNLPMTITYQWQSNDSGGWVDIDDETTSEYEIDAGLTGEQIRCAVTATNAKGATVKNTTATAAVTA